MEFAGTVESRTVHFFLKKFIHRAEHQHLKITRVLVTNLKVQKRRLARLLFSSQILFFRSGVRHHLSIRVQMFHVCLAAGTRRPGAWGGVGVKTGLLSTQIGPILFTADCDLAMMMLCVPQILRENSVTRFLTRWMISWPTSRRRRPRRVRTASLPYLYSDSSRTV